MKKALRTLMVVSLVAVIFSCKSRETPPPPAPPAPPAQTQAPPPAPTPAPSAAEIDWSPYSLSAEAKRIADLGVSFTEPGNAAEAYIPYIGDQKDCQDKETKCKGTSPLLSKEWFEKITTEMVLEKPANEEEAKMLSATVKEAQADLDQLVAASKKKEYKLWGEHWKYNPAFTLFEQPVPSYFALLKLSQLLIARGNELVQAGDPKAGEEQFLAAFRIGHQLTIGETIVRGYALGDSIKRTAAKRLAKFYEEQGNQELARKWSEYVQWSKSRNISETFQKISHLPQEQVKALVENQDLPLAFRLEAILQYHYCVQEESALLKCIATGTPQWVKDLEAKFAAESEVNKSYMEAIAKDRPSRHAWDLFRQRRIVEE